MKKSLSLAEAIKDLERRIEKLPVKFVPFRVKTTPRGIEDFKEDDESTTYRRGETVWYKAHPKAEPEIIVYKGWAIWNYNEFIGDVVEEGVSYRLAYNPISEKILAYKIVCLDGENYLENPANITISKKYEKQFFEENLPERDKLQTAYNTYQRIKKRIEKEKKDRDSKKQPVGNKPKANLLRSTLWCIRNHHPKLKHKRPTILRAYKKFGEGHIEDSFVRLVYRKWNVFEKDYKAQSAEFKKQNSKENYAREFFRVPRNNSKQKTNENKLRLN